MEQSPKREGNFKHVAKLHFRYGAMNSGKSTDVLQTAYNYEERGMSVVLVKPAIDTKAGGMVSSRLGIERSVDVLVDTESDIRERIAHSIAARALKQVGCVLVDEAQFLEPHHIDGLWEVSKLDDIPVIAYGLRTDFQTNLFPGSRRLLELADNLEERPTICRCGQKARFNSRKIDGEFVFTGDQVVIDDQARVEYESLCGTCYLTKRQEAGELARTAMMAAPLETVAPEAV